MTTWTPPERRRVSTIAELPRDLVSAADSVVAGYDEVLCAFISGSHVEGMATPTSDLDLYVVSPHQIRGRDEANVSMLNGEAIIDVRSENGLRVDTEIWTMAAVRAAARDIAECDPADLTAVLCLDSARLELAHRLHTALPLRNAALVRSLKDLVDHAQLRSLLATRALYEWDSLEEDTRGSLAVGDLATAQLVSRMALGSAIDAFLAARGNSNPRAKWRFARLALCQEKDVAQRYLELESRTGTSATALAGTARERLDFGREIVAHALTWLESVRPVTT